MLLGNVRASLTRDDAQLALRLLAQGEARALDAAEVRLREEGIDALLDDPRLLPAIIESRIGLAADGVEASVLVVSSLNPAPTEDLVEALADIPLALSAEAHYVNGALGSLVAETIAEHALPCRLIRAGLRAMPIGATGSRPHLYARHGLAPDQLAASVLRALDGAPAPVTTGAQHAR